MLAGSAELANDASVQLHFVNLAVIKVGGPVGIGAVKILVRPRRDADGPRRANICILSFRVAIVIEHLKALIAPITHIDVTLCINRDRMGRIELSWLGSSRSPGLYELAVLIEFRYPRVPVSIRHKNIAG